MAEQMSAREAWEIARAGMPSLSSMVAYPVSGERYARACAIVEAEVNFAEAATAYYEESDPARSGSMCRAMMKAFDKMRALERGEAGE